jgi:hypothetical protein
LTTRTRQYIFLGANAFSNFRGVFHKSILSAVDAN